MWSSQECLTGAGSIIFWTYNLKEKEIIRIHYEKKTFKKYCVMVQGLDKASAFFAKSLEEAKLKGIVKANDLGIKINII